MNSWNVLGASREPTFPVFVTCVDPVGRMGIPLASPIFCGFFETIHDPLSALLCPLGPNVNRWAALNMSTLAYPIFCVFFETIHDNLSAIPCPLGPNLNCWDALGASREPTFQVFVTCVGTMGRLGITLASSIFCGFFETIHDPLSAIPCPLGPNVNSWDALGASREPYFSLTRPVWAQWADWA